MIDSSEDFPHTYVILNPDNSELLILYFCVIIIYFSQILYLKVFMQFCLIKYFYFKI